MILLRIHKKIKSGLKNHIILILVKLSRLEFVIIVGCMLTILCKTGIFLKLGFN